MTARTHAIRSDDRSRALVVGLRLPGGSQEETVDSLDELTALSESAEIDVRGRFIQSRGGFVPATGIGRGKAEEIAASVESEKADLVIFDEELTSVQVRNLEEIVKARVVTRTEVILDIFARRARTHEAKLQVELAQLEFSVTRLRHLWTHLEGQRGGRGARQGAGERQIEVDRRQARARMALLKRRLEEIRRRRTVQRSARLGFPVGAVVGYTNVGKSTLLNRLAHTELPTENKLFATLDAATRRVNVGGGRIVLLTDTVGFIRKFPPALAASFRSTIEEALDADFLIHVADAAHPKVEEQILTVEEFLKEMRAEGRPVVKVLNKADIVKKSVLLPGLISQGWMTVSAVTGAGIANLKQVIRERLAARTLGETIPAAATEAVGD